MSVPDALQPPSSTTIWARSTKCFPSPASRTAVGLVNNKAVSARQEGHGGKGPLLLSPSQFGWPASRPQLYTILIKRNRGQLRGDGLAHVHRLFRSPTATCKDLMCAPQEWVTLMLSSVFFFRTRWRNIAWCWPQSSIETAGPPSQNCCQAGGRVLLHACPCTGAQPVWLDGYKKSQKVAKLFNQGVCAAYIYSSLQDTTRSFATCSRTRGRDALSPGCALPSSLGVSCLRFTSLLATRAVLQAQARLLPCLLKSGHCWQRSWSS